jgi:hypothetical protein
MLADIAHGEVDTADILFLVGVFLAAVAAILYMLATTPQPRRVAVVVWAPVFGWLAVACLGAGWLVL